MTTLREAAEMALDALTKIHPGNMSLETGDAWLNAVQILREALATCKQDLQVEPVNESAQEIKRLQAELFEALSKQHVEAEPVACIGTNGELMWLNKPNAVYSKARPLYTAPLQRKPLMDEEIVDAIAPLYQTRALARMAAKTSMDEYRAIERAHGIGGEE